jgi:hypothetical protein
MNYADLHIHPTLKTQFSDAPDKIKPDEKVKTDAVLKGIVRLCSDFEEVIQSQSNLRQLINNRVKIACFALYSPEPEIIGNRTLSSVVRNNDEARKYISLTRLTAFRNNELPPFEFTRDHELATAINFESAELGKVIPLTKNTVLNDNTDKNIYVVFSIEGCHCLLNTMDDYKDTTTLASVINNNLQQLLDEGVPVFAINLTHLADYTLCNHAFGMQFLYNKGFYPKHNGFGEAAKDVTLFCYNNNIHIDIKHLSIKSRKDLYRIRIEEGIELPLVCTHAGFTGIGYKRYPNYIYKLRDEAADYYYMEMCKPRGHVEQTSFNANTINLFDEDIAEILKTRGLIGISLDKRILGYTDPDSGPYHPNDMPDELLEVDYFSYREYHDPLMYANRNEYGDMANESFCLTRSEINEISPTGSHFRDFHFNHIVNHIAHVFIVALQNRDYIGLDPLDAIKNHLCIGSDFDGLINPVSCATSVEDFGSFYGRFTNNFKDVFNAALNFNLSDEDAQTIRDNFFYENAKKFIVNWAAGL